MGQCRPRPLSSSPKVAQQGRTHNLKFVVVSSIPLKVTSVTQHNTHTKLHNKEETSPQHTPKVKPFKVYCKEEITPQHNHDNYTKWKIKNKKIYKTI